MGKIVKFGRNLREWLLLYLTIAGVLSALFVFMFYVPKEYAYYDCGDYIPIKGECPVVTKTELVPVSAHIEDFFRGDFKIFAYIFAWLTGLSAFVVLLLSYVKYGRFLYIWIKRRFGREN